MEDNKYPNKIDRSWSQVNNDIFDFLKPKVKGRFLDVGCNYAVLQRELPNGVGTDMMADAVRDCQKDGLDVRLHDANTPFPFKDKEFDTVVLSCVLQQLTNPINALEESIRVGKRVIGITPSDKSRQLIIGEHGGWVRSFTSSDILEKYKAKIQYYDRTKMSYYFEILCP